MKLDINKMVDNFLSWKLPSGFSPDAGINFQHGGISDYGTCWWPTGTNLFTATQAKAMIEHMLVGAVSKPSYDEEREEIASEHLDDVIAWLSARGLYDANDYLYEGPDFSAILTLHENELITPQLAKRVKELTHALEIVVHELQQWTLTESEPESIEALRVANEALAKDKP